MNRKQFITLVVLVVVVGAAGLMIYNKQNQERRTGQVALGKKLVANLPINDIAHITIRHDTNEVNLVKKDDFWKVKERGDYPANFSEISGFLLKLNDLKVVQYEQVGPSQLPRLALATGQGTNSPVQVELKDKSNKTAETLLLGKKHMRKSNRPNPMSMGMDDDQGWPDGRYVKVASAKDVALVSEPFTEIEPKPDQWLHKDFFHVEKVKEIGVEYPGAPTNSWRLTRETESGEWKLAEAKPAEQLDASKNSGLASALSSPSFADVVINPNAELLGLAKPIVVTLKTFENFNYTVKVGQKTNDQYAMTIAVVADLPKERTPGKDEKAEDKDKLDKEWKEQQKKLQDKLAKEKAYEAWTYLVASWTLDSVLKERGQLMAEKKDEPKPESGSSGDTTNKVDLSTGTGAK